MLDEEDCKSVTSILCRILSVMMMLIVLLLLAFCVDIVTSSVSSAFITIATKTTSSYSSFASSASSLPDLNYGLSDEDFKSWLVEEVQGCPGRNTYSSVYEDSINAIVQWRRRFRGDPSLCKSCWYYFIYEWFWMYEVVRKLFSINVYYICIYYVRQTLVESYRHLSSWHTTSYISFTGKRVFKKERVIKGARNLLYRLPAVSTIETKEYG